MKYKALAIIAVFIVIGGVAFINPQWIPKESFTSDRATTTPTFIKKIIEVKAEYTPDFLEKVHAEWEMKQIRARLVELDRERASSTERLKQLTEKGFEKEGVSPKRNSKHSLRRSQILITCLTNKSCISYNMNQNGTPTHLEI